MVPVNDRHEITVQAVILNAENQILLVHERGEDGNKPPGWGMPGGGVDKKSKALKSKILKLSRSGGVQIDEDDFSGLQNPDSNISDGLVIGALQNQIFNFLPFYGIDEANWLRLLGMETQVQDLILLLTLIKECLEETGFLVLPKQILFEESNAPGHKIMVMLAEIVDGKIQKRSLETDDCDWFPTDQLPAGIYGSHVRRISKARAALQEEVA
jgi:8-oxo-dGTP pyrophosphatase MutT (NUDIX family)